MSITPIDKIAIHSPSEIHVDFIMTAGVQWYLTVDICTSGGFLGPKKPMIKPLILAHP